MMNDALKRKTTARLRKVAGQVAGIERMVDDNRYCLDILLQIAAAQAALRQVGNIVLRSHVETCVSEAMTRGKPAERRKKIEELMDVFARHGALGSR
jgi:DNA-binding FrmR family transcriptional regulator